MQGNWCLSFPKSSQSRTGTEQYKSRRSFSCSVSKHWTCLHRINLYPWSSILSSFTFWSHPFNHHRHFHHRSSSTILFSSCRHHHHQRRWLQWQLHHHQRNYSCRIDIVTLLFNSTRFIGSSISCPIHRWNNDDWSLNTWRSIWIKCESGSPIDDRESDSPVNLRLWLNRLEKNTVIRKNYSLSWNCLFN